MKSLLLSVAIFSALAVCGQTSPRTQLSVLLTSDRTSYRLADDIRLDVARKNTGVSGLFIYSRWEWGISKIRVFDSKGNEVKDAMYPLPVDDPPLLTAADFVLLQPGQSSATRIDRRASDLVKSHPGEYELIVEYVPVLPSSLARRYIGTTGTPFWSSKRGTVMSNRIKIRVTP